MLRIKTVPALKVVSYIHCLTATLGLDNCQSFFSIFLHNSTVYFLLYTVYTLNLTILASHFVFTTVQKMGCTCRWLTLWLS